MEANWKEHQRRIAQLTVHHCLIPVPMFQPINESSKRIGQLLKVIYEEDRGIMNDLAMSVKLFNCILSRNKSIT